MVIKINSTNDYLLDILNKNPNSELGLYMKEHRNGVIVGNCIDKHNYHAVFYDSKHSYTNYEDNQLDFKSHCDAKVVISMVNELFSDLIKEKEQVLNKNLSWLNKTIKDIDTEECIITIENIFIDSNWLRNDEFLLCRYIDGLVLTKKSSNLFQLTLTSPDIFTAINNISFITFLMAVTNEDERLFLTDELIMKFIRILSNIKNIPYFVYYLFIKRCLIYKTTVWDKVKPLLEKSLKDNTNLDCTFTPNDTHTDRIEYVKTNINLTNDILDFGCGEFRHFKKLAKLLDNEKTYYGYDIEDYSNLVNVLSERYPKSNLVFSTDINTVPKNKPLSVILSEVIEHNSLEEGKKIIQDIVNNFNVKQIIITTPNKDFNQFYNMAENELRRDDHVFELNYGEFLAYINSLKFNKAIKSIILDKLSDNVNGISVSSGVIINF